MRHAIIGLLIFSASPAWAQQEPTGSWDPRGSGWMFLYGASASDGTYVYFFGGNQYNATSNSSFPATYSALRRYDPVANVWVSLASMPEATYFNCGAYVSGSLYSFGNGYYGTGAIHRYVIAGNSWQTLSATLRGNRYAAAAATHLDKVYVAGGEDPNTWASSNLLDLFDPSNGSITARTNLPTARGYLAAATALGKVYAIGGYDYASGASLATLEAYDPVANTWAAKADLDPRDSLMAFTINDRIYAVGGFDGSPLKSVLEYRPLKDQWTQRADMKLARYLCGGGVVSTSLGPRAFVHGGYPESGAPPTTGELFTPPNFTPPNAPSNVRQLANGIELPQGASTGGMIRIEATVTDPDPGRQVGLRARVRPSSSDPASPDAWTVFDSQLQSQGTVGVDAQLPAGDGYDWEYQVYNSLQNPWPADPAGDPMWQSCAGNGVSPDFVKESASPPPSGSSGGSSRRLGCSHSVDAGPGPIQLGLAGLAIVFACRRRSRCVLALCVAIIAGAALPAAAQEIAYWKPQGSGLTFSNGGSASDGTYVYFFGGYQSGSAADGSYSFLRRYDPVADTWTTLASMPVGTSGNAGAYYNGCLYSFGNQEFSSGAIYRYSIASNNWQTLSSTLRDDRTAAAAVTLGNRIYIMGGIALELAYYYDEYYGESWQYLASVASQLLDEFDPSDNSITPRANMPTARGHLGAAAAQGKVFAIGGSSDSYPSSAVEAYDPAADSWSVVSSLPSPSRGPFGFAIGGKIYAAGGFYYEYLNSCHEYDPDTNQWTPRGTMLKGRESPGGGTVSTAAGPVAFVYGTNGGPGTGGELFSLSGFGYRPNAPANVEQIWAGSQVAQGGNIQYSARFQMTVTDPDSDQQVGMRVRVRRSSANPANSALWTVLDTQLQSQGTLHVDYAMPAPGPYDWEYQVYDSLAIPWPAGSGGGPGWQPFGSANVSPDFVAVLGDPPNEPVDVAQIGEAGPIPQGGFTRRVEGYAAAGPRPLDFKHSRFFHGRHIRLQMTVTDPDAGQTVGLRVRLKRTTANSWTTFDTGLGPQGVLGFDIELGAEGSYDWEYQVYDSFGNGWPVTSNGAPLWHPFGGNGVSPDFDTGSGLPPQIPWHAADDSDSEPVFEAKGFFGAPVQEEALMPSGGEKRSVSERCSASAGGPGRFSALVAALLAVSLFLIRSIPGRN